MIRQEKFLIFAEGEQKKFLLDVKSKLGVTWKTIICHSHVSKAMFYNYLKEKNILNERVFNLLAQYANLEKSQYSFKTTLKQQNDAEIPTGNKEAFAEFIGILLGDGHLSKFKFQIVITLNSALESAYLNDKVKPLLSTLFNLEPKIRTFKGKKAVQIYFASKKVFNFLNQQMGVPSKRRINNPSNKIPLSFFQNKKLLQACLRGLFDTEGSLSIRHHRAIRLSIYKNSDYLLSSIAKALADLGYTPIKKHKSVRLNRTSEILKFFKEIGSNNPYKLKRYLAWHATGKLPNVNTAVL